jgi:nuclear-control-of-ATPase protein 2
VTKSLGFWETKLHDTHGKIWWFLLLQTGPGHFVGELYRGLQDLLSVCSSTLRRSKARQLPPMKLPRTSPHLVVDGKVRALSALQFSLCVAVGEVHRYAGIVAAAWGSSADSRNTAYLRATLHDALDGLIITLQGVSMSKSLLPSSESQQILQEGRLSQTVPRSPLSKAVNTEFSRHPGFVRTPVMDARKSDPILEINEDDAMEGNDGIWQLVHLLECEGSKASSSAKTVIAANAKPQKWQCRWVSYSALATAFGSLSLFTIRHSRLCGSSDLDQLIQGLWAGIIRFWNTHAATPWREIRAELTLAFEQNTDVVGIEQLESSKASLDRMLKQYTVQATRPGYSAALYRAYRTVGGGKTEQGTLEPIPLDPFALVTARVEEELKSPLQNMLGGDLMQLLLIQTQVMKVDMESALLQMDQILRANRLNFSLMAGLPTLLALVSMFSLGSTSLGTRTHRERSQHREDMRLLLAEAERALVELRYPPSSRATGNQSFERGMLLFALNTLFQSVQRHRQFFTPAEWRSVRRGCTRFDVIS